MRAPLRVTRLLSQLSVCLLISVSSVQSAIAQSGLIPTRVAGEGAWHDYFNALVWLTLPLTNSAINLRQAEAIAQLGVSGERGPLRDALTVFDESAVVWREKKAAPISRHERALAC